MSRKFTLRQKIKLTLITFGSLLYIPGISAGTQGTLAQIEIEQHQQKSHSLALENPRLKINPKNYDYLKNQAYQTTLYGLTALSLGATAIGLSKRIN